VTSDAFDQTADAGTGNAGPVALAPGAHLGKYRLDRVLGEGGMGVVWAAHDPDLERAVAIKVLRYAQASQQLRQRLLREARAMAKLKHPNVLTVYEVGTVGDRDYIAMELVDGMTLDGWLALAPTEEERWAAVLAAGRGLAAAHEAGVVHRDFKPHNVLRSREGRILVTDFGLARGTLAEQDSAALGDDAPDAPEAASAHAASVLDAQLTQTGALIGTPAYMAPEQYRGAPPDPRTDQFAFCVTAWQALTGERPFKGDTLEALRTSASAGVAHVETTLPREVRAVLVRGLDPAAERRWPSLDVLLDELDRALARPRQRRRLVTIAAGFAAFVAIGIGLVLASRGSAPVKTGCDDPDAQFAEAWSPALRATLAGKTDERNAARIADQLDRYSEGWIDSYAKACRARPAKHARSRIACLEGIRDRAAAITTMLRDIDPSALWVFDPRDAVPPVASCETASPLAPPRVPSEQPRRGKILAVIGRALALRAAPPAQLTTATDALLGDAAALGWEPLTSLVLVAAGQQYLRSSEPMLAREMFGRALASLPAAPELRDLRIEGSAYIGLLEASLAELEDPRATVPAAINDPKAKVPLHGELALRITKATNAAAGDPLLLASRSLLAGLAYADAAQWNRYPSGYDEALRLVADARKQFDELGDAQRWAQAAYAEASIYLQRGDDRALDDALFVARRGQDALEAAHLPRHAGLDRIRATVAFARRDYSELYRILQARGAREPVSVPAPLVRGHVVGEHADRAVVVAWRGDVVGHARSIAMDPGSVTGAIVKVERDGTFAIHAEPGWAIMAEAQGARSTPRPVGTGTLALELQPTVTISGQLQGRNWFGVKAFARYAVGPHSWTMQTPIDKDGAFDLRGLPPGPRSYGAEGPAGTGTRTIVAGGDAKDVSWTYGQAIEVIVRAAQIGTGARVWVVRGTHDITTRAQLDALVAAAPDVASSGVYRIGSTNTDAGRELYRAGDRHAVIAGNSDGIYTVCATALTGGRLLCRAITVRASVTLDYADGRFGGGVTPILFEL